MGNFEMQIYSIVKCFFFKDLLTNLNIVIYVW